MNKPVILTGLRANSEFHLGNYLGAILPMIDLQAKYSGKYQLNMFVPDLHSFTTPIDHSKLYKQILKNLKIYVAAGLDINNNDIYVYRQSFIPAHSELAWILSCFTGFGEASRMVEFKDKAQSLGEQGVSVGLFNYPILMAADILLYDGEWIPVGEDQRQHLELARTLAERFNKRFGKVFVVPKNTRQQQEFIDRDSAPRIRSLRNPEKKMSKSIDDPTGTIMLSDTPSEAVKKILGATTDSLSSINLNWNEQPGVSNLMQILALLSGKTLKEVAEECKGKENYGHLKRHVADQVTEFLIQLHDKLATVDEKALLAKLESGETAMNKVANAKLLQVQKAIGLR